MARITVKIDDTVEKQVRIRLAYMGGKKGDLAKAVEEGLLLWLLDKAREAKEEREVKEEREAKEVT